MAHTLPAANASPRVLETLGLRLDGTDVAPDEGTVWRGTLRR